MARTIQPIRGTQRRTPRKPNQGAFALQNRAMPGGSAEAPFKPYDLFEVWYDGDHYEDDSGNASVIINKGTLGVDYNMDQGQASNQAPVQISSNFNDQNVFALSSPVYYALSNSYDVDYESDFEHLCVIEKGGTWLMWLGGSATLNYCCVMANNIAYINANNSVTALSINPNGFNNPGIYYFYGNGATFNCYIGENGALFSTPIVTTGTAICDEGFTFKTPATQYSGGEAAQGAYNRQISSVENINNAANWLADKYGLTWTEIT